MKKNDTLLLSVPSAETAGGWIKCESNPVLGKTGSTILICTYDIFYSLQFLGQIFASKQFSLESGD